MEKEIIQLDAKMLPTVFVEEKHKDKIIEKKHNVKKEL